MSSKYKCLYFKVLLACMSKLKNNFYLKKTDQTFWTLFFLFYFLQPCSLIRTYSMNHNNKVFIFIFFTDTHNYMTWALTCCSWGWCPSPGSCHSCQYMGLHVHTATHTCPGVAYPTHGAPRHNVRSVSSCLIGRICSGWLECRMSRPTLIGHPLCPSADACSLEARATYSNIKNTSFCSDAPCSIENAIIHLIAQSKHDINLHSYW